MLDTGCGERRRAGPGCPKETRNVRVAQGGLPVVLLRARVRCVRRRAPRCTLPARSPIGGGRAQQSRVPHAAAPGPRCPRVAANSASWTVRGHGPPEGREEQAVYGGRAGGEGGRGAGEERAGAGEGGGREGRCAPYCAQLLLAVLRGSRLHA